MTINRKTPLLILATALGMAGAAQVRGDHAIVQQHAEELACQMEELRDVFRSQFRRAGNYSELRGAALEIRSGARRMGRLARSGRDLCEVRAELAPARGSTRRSTAAPTTSMAGCLPRAALPSASPSW
jgi:hypothetical protein